MASACVTRVFASTHVGKRSIVSSVQIREAVFGLFAHVGVVVLFRAAFGIPNRRSQRRARSRLTTSTAATTRRDAEQVEDVDGDW